MLLRKFNFQRVNNLILHFSHVFTGCFFLVSELFLGSHYLHKILNLLHLDWLSFKLYFIFVSFPSCRLGLEYSFHEFWLAECQLFLLVIQELFLHGAVFLQFSYHVLHTVHLLVHLFKLAVFTSDLLLCISKLFFCRFELLIDLTVPDF